MKSLQKDFNQEIPSVEVTDDDIDIDFCDISRSEKTILVFLKYFSHN